MCRGGGDATSAARPLLNNGRRNLRRKQHRQADHQRERQRRVRRVRLRPLRVLCHGAAPPPPCPPPPPPPQGALAQNSNHPVVWRDRRRSAASTRSSSKSPRTGSWSRASRCLSSSCGSALPVPHPLVSPCYRCSLASTPREVSLSLSPRRRVLADRCPHLAHRGHVHRGKCAIAPAHTAGTPSSAPRETLAHAPSPQATDFLRFTSASSPPSASPCPSSISRTPSLSRLTRRRRQHAAQPHPASAGIRGVPGSEIPVHDN